MPNRAGILCLVLLSPVGCMNSSTTSDRNPADRNADPDDEQFENRAITAAFGLRTTTSTTWDQSLPDSDHVLSEAQRKRLRAEWHKPEVKADENGVFIELSGRIYLAADGRRPEQPVDWPLPIRVLVGKAAARPDWTNHYSDSDTASSDIIAGPVSLGQVQMSLDFRLKLPPDKNRRPGDFVAIFGVGELDRLVGVTKAFQVGICLGRKEGKKLTWTNVAPVLPRTLATVDIPGPKPLSRTLQLINGCPAGRDGEYDPLAVVRAVNHLQSLGKDKAISALRDYLAIAPKLEGSTLNVSRPENIDYGDPMSVRLLLWLLFRSADGVKWPSRPVDLVSVSDGIPFQSCPIDGVTGNPRPELQPKIEWALKHGKLIDKPLRPSDSPLEAADALLRTIENTKSKEGPADRRLKVHVRFQAWQMVRRLVEPGQEPLSPISTRQLRNEESWTALKEKAAKAGIRWDEKRQEYTLAQP